MSVLLTEALRSSTYRFALICIGIFGAAVFALFGFVYLATVAYVQGSFDHEIAVKQQTLRKSYERVGRQSAASIVHERVIEEGFAGTIYLIADPSWRPIAGNLNEWPVELKTEIGWGTFILPDGSPVRALSATFPDGDRLLVGKRLAGLARFANRIKMAFLLGIAFIFLLAGVASISVTRRTVGRIEAINATTRAIMRSGLGERIPRRKTHDEWDHLAENLNVMLDRIELLVSEVKEVSDNVAHDLRTPLARIRGRLEQAYGRQRDGEIDQVLIGRTLADLDDVLRMFASLTRISRIEANAPNVAAEPVNLSILARDVTELFDAAAEQKRTHLHVVGDQESLVSGDRDLLFDALANLVDNAIKHGKDGGQVIVNIGNHKELAILSVADDGPGIPCGEYQHVLKRFYRLESSRHTPGNGLGLSLVAAVARFHGVVVEMADNAPGLIVTLRFVAAVGIRDLIITT